MAVYGFCDADMATYFPVMPNLEIMKMMAYYGRGNDFLVLQRTLKNTGFTKFFIRKDYDDGDYDWALLREPNVSFGGYAFSQEGYTPLPIDIEMTVPDPSWYKVYEPQLLHSTGDVQKAWHFYMKDVHHLRLSLDGKTLWKDLDFAGRIMSPRDSEFTTVFLHDRDLSAIEDVREGIRSIPRFYKSKELALAVKFPINVYSEEELFKWMEFNWIPDEFKITYHGLLSDETFKKIMVMSTKNSYFEYIPTYGMRDEEQFLSNLPKLFRQITFAVRTNRLLYLSSHLGFFDTVELNDLLGLLSSYVGTVRSARRIFMFRNYGYYVEKEGTFFNFLRTLRDEKLEHQSYDKEDGRRVIRALLDYDPDLVNWMYRLISVEMKGGIFIDEKIDKR